MLNRKKWLKYTDIVLFFGGMAVSLVSFIFESTLVLSIGLSALVAGYTAPVYCSKKLPKSNAIYLGLWSGAVGSSVIHDQLNIYILCTLIPTFFVSSVFIGRATNADYSNIRSFQR
ncbi:hypothetical protein [Vibrio alginolyticus]|uniref:hypothetical protein n=1 Tax=Vibrio alginolyticus TaxID=663 RepID=UPI0015F5FA09|nr:hypothetical protein [Vibrio alginolyticus]EJE4208771.1 hypothetical protein [Vibrio parahaemolyticus]